MTISLFALTFTISVKKRRETLAEAVSQERIRSIQDTLIDQRVNYHMF
ncbi:MAG: YrzI family small protein [Tuberibacillus sp.]